jgi:lysophospholipase L1-like esterase
MPTPGIYDETSVQKSHELATYVKNTATETDSIFLDAGPITSTGDDGIHLNPASQSVLARALYDLITA